MKICCHCQKNKDLEDFSKLSKAKDGRNYICRTCDSDERQLNKKEKYTKLQIDDYIFKNNIIDKNCLTCKSTKTLEKFPKDLRIKDGAKNICKVCEYARKKKERELKVKAQQEAGQISNFSEENIAKFKKIFELGTSIRKIGNYFNLKRDKVKEILKILNLNASERNKNKAFKPENYNENELVIKEVLDKNYFIYAIINKANKKIYVGQTIDIKSRWLKHVATARDESNNLPLYSSIRKHGIDNFSIEIIDTLNTLQSCNQQEVYWINYLDTMNLNNGYNIQSGGLNYTVSKETKIKMSKATAGNKNPFFGKKHNQETKDKIRSLRLGSKASAETKEKMSSQRQGEKNSMFGRGHTDDSKNKISKTRKEKFKNDPTYGRIIIKK